MLKFFRIIRQKHLTKNKASKYMFYAIGEMSLLVIGILIALQINNWNENKKATVNELKLLKQIEQDLLENESEYEDLRKSNQRYLKAGSYVLKHITAELPLTDSLLHYFSETRIQKNFNPVNTSYVYLMNSSLNELKNDRIRVAITKLYEQDINLINSRNNKLLAIQSDHLDPFMANHFKSKEIEYNNRYYITPMVEPIDYEKLILNEKYKNILALKNQRLNINLARLSLHKSDLEKLILLIREEIDKHEIN